MTRRYKKNFYAKIKKKRCNEQTIEIYQGAFEQSITYYFNSLAYSLKQNCLKQNITFDTLYPDDYILNDPDAKKFAFRQKLNGHLTERVPNLLSADDITVLCGALNTNETNLLWEHIDFNLMYDMLMLDLLNMSALPISGYLYEQHLYHLSQSHSLTRNEAWWISYNEKKKDKIMRLKKLFFSHFIIYDTGTGHKLSKFVPRFSICLEETILEIYQQDE